MISGGTTPFPSPHKYIALVDGENLVCRFQAMAKSRMLNPNIIHIQDVFIWHQHLGGLQPGWSGLRLNYFTSVTATDDRIAELEERISKVPMVKSYEEHSQVCPRVFKKHAQSKKTKLVDISIAIDALRHSYHRHVDAILLYSGDGDYLPLINEIMRNGTQVWLGAFSDGLNPALRSKVDRFIDLDSWFFIR
jgi:hypothetical protein